ncbi:complement C4 [Amia ocellicauda]|uniref:complement C4 n=1 Tax=Amia ocellicauda TaxID=2972642 RepID=UPI003464611D
MGFYLMLTLAALTALAELAPLCLITAPNIINLGEEETVAVQLHDATGVIKMRLYFEDQREYPYKRLSDEIEISLNGGNQYQAVAKLTVDPTKYVLSKQQRSKNLPNPYVTLVAINNVFKNPMKELITLSTRKGYIFIQTDKPIYTPSEIVNFRIYTLDNYMAPSDATVEINIFNSKGLRIYYAVKRTHQILKQHITIPDVEQAGNWKIVASFHDFPMSNSTAEFQVKEYVLPSFEVKIQAFKPYYMLKEKSFPFNISARYTYGKGISGIAYVRFGVIDEVGNRIFLPDIEIQTSLQDGLGNVTLLTETLLTTAEKRNVTDLEGFHLYIAVMAFETASGELEETESTNVKIVTTPYLVDLSKTKQYFSPEGSFSILATTTYPDGTAAPNVKMKAEVHVAGGHGGSINLEGTGNQDGETVLTFKVPKMALGLHITVIAEGSSSDITSKVITATPFHSKSKSYLSIEVPHTILGPGEAMDVTFKDITPGIDKPTYIYYVMVSKGKVIRANRVQRTDTTKVRLPFHFDMVPAFRLIAYFYTKLQEVVADSVWVDVRDVCKGQIKVTPSKEEYRPAETMEFLIETDQAGKVALAAVDTAVYILNKQNKLTPKKMFDYMNSYDLACSPGGGHNTEQVFYDAGLTFLSSFGFEANRRLEYNCKRRKQRQKRAYTYYAEFSKIVNKQSNPVLKKCCNDGAKLSPMRFSCEKRVTKAKHSSPDCQQVFLECCKQATTLREKIQKSKRRLNLARTDVIENENAIDENDIRLRSFFPQTWLWDVLDVPESGRLSHKTVLPDSITTWEMQAIGISERQGFCIVEPTKFRVFQDFFVSLKLPYSVKRHEQLEVKAVVYNYRPESLEVTVMLKTTQELCSPDNMDGKQKVTVPGNSAVPVYFSVVPLDIGEIPLHVTAHASSKISDAVQKNLKVVAEGVLMSTHYEYNLDGAGAKTRTIEIPDMDNTIPGVESEAYASIKGGAMGESAQNCLNLEGVEKLIRLPTGCAEQTMVKMSPAIHAMRYLDASEQWIYLKADSKDKAIEMIQSGYTTILTFKKDDGSYGAFLTRPSSIWLTAFIAKELTRCKAYIEVEDAYIRESISYLVSKQLASGAFNDPNPLYDRTMQGGVGGAEVDASLTSFVIVAMHHALEAYPRNETSEVSASIHKAVTYLSQRLDSLQRPFAVAITAYALTLVRPRSDIATQAQSKLRGLATCDDGNKQCYWKADESLRLVGETRKRKVPEASSISVEATAYALLQTLLVNDKEYATSIARWLTEQRKYGGGFRSTQDTVVALEALSQYSIQLFDVEDLNLTVELCNPRGKKETVNLSKMTALTVSAFQVRPGEQMVVNIEGKGKGTLTIVQTYRTMKVTDSVCDYYKLEVSLQGELEYKSSFDYEDDLGDYYNYDYESPSADEPMSRIEWFDLRTRRKRQAVGSSEKESSLLYTVCVSTNGLNATGMAIVDISLLSGLEPNIQDLEERVKSTDKYIDRYDLGAGKLFLYFYEITNINECVSFGAKQIAPIGMVQPANAVIYDYYNPERRCNIFYSAPKQSNMVSKLCSEDVCVCAEGRCPKIKSTFSKMMTDNTRFSFACFSPIVDYAYVIKVLNTTQDGVFDYYAVDVTQTLHISKDEALLTGNTFRSLIKRQSCEFSMKPDKKYLVMGKDFSSTDTTDSKGNIQYFLNHEVWVEQIPEETKCRATRSRKACKLLHDFMQNYGLEQCALK